DNRLGLVYQF
nr:Chain D, activating peptide1SOZ_E Chain E, activating peptide4RQZ_D Chain D, activating peptide [synthetic construct]4RQZ_E Chain E, activating peptide [synthetic construct]4RQZ_F Chain F, activating peptide [synthetic construct]6EW9_P Chain P, DNRLGLVYQF PEPTIDE [synthetic construct]6EW9_Q Chain Q, DNRLGLVYQF PEPTIDE [synthetic construct]6EW9_R Chain R, DNRLGLVYQF PEPTIDE [synthetic construct]